MAVDLWLTLQLSRFNMFRAMFMMHDDRGVSMPPEPQAENTYDEFVCASVHVRNISDWRRNMPPPSWLLHLE